MDTFKVEGPGQVFGPARLSAKDFDPSMMSKVLFTLRMEVCP